MPAVKKKSVKEKAVGKPAAKTPAGTYELKTKPTAVSVKAFIEGVDSETRRRDAKAVLALMRKITGAEPKMWGPSIVGFGSYHYKYDSGHEGDMAAAGFSPRKAATVLYIAPGFSGYEALLKKLGPHKTGASCLYINKLADVDLKVLEAIIRKSWERMQEKYGKLA